MNIIIVGAGEVGRHLAESLSNQAHNICVLEASDKLAAELNERLDVAVFCCNGQSVSSLADANVAECDLFLALTSNVATNLVSASLAKSLGARKTIARVDEHVQGDEWMFDYKGHFGIDYLFSSERLAAVELAKYVRNPDGRFVEELARGRIELQQAEVDPGSKAAGQKLIDLKFPSRVRIASIQRRGGSIIPTAQDTLEPNDLVTVFGEPLKVTEVLRAIHSNGKDNNEPNVVIFSGGECGFALAQMLEGGKCRVRIMERDEALCQQLSSKLQKTVVINGDATSLQLLREEQVGTADFFIATSRDDEDNVMTCLQAKSLGTRYCLALIHRADYADVMSHNAERLGLHAAISNQVITSRDLLRFVTSDRFHVVMSLPGGAEVLETTIAKASRVAGKKVSEIKWPEGSGLVAVIHDQQAAVPIGDDVLNVGDTVYGIVAPSAKKAFVKLIAD